MQVEINKDRLRQIVTLDSGGHASFEQGVCALEAASYVANEQWSDRPECVCPVIAAFMRSWNDALSDDKRNEYLLPLIPRIIGTKATKAIEKSRSLMAADWLVRIHTPAWLQLAGLSAQAEALASLPEITDMAQVPSICAPIEAARRATDAAWAAARAAARDAAWDAAWDSAWATARDAAWAAARDAAWVAARDAARAAAWAAAWVAARDAAWAAAWAAAGDAAWAAARDAAGDAAGDAAWVAARDAAWAKLKPTMHELQLSAVALLQRMIEGK